MARMHGLDGMRGAAMVCVAIMHAYGSTPATFWIWTTPDMFFALSGFLITGILLRDFSASWPSLRIFWMRRIIRIWPVYYLALCSTLAIFVLVPMLLGRDTREIEYLSESFFFLQFWRDYLPSNFGAPIVGWWEDYVPWFGHAWTLAMEEQYYLLWPLLLMSLLPRPRLLMAAMIALLVMAMLLRYSGMSLQVLAARSDGLLFGSALALFHHGVFFSSPAARRRVFVIGTVLVVPAFIGAFLYIASTLGWWGISGINERTPFVVLSFTYLYTAVITCVVYRPEGFFSRIFSTRVLLYFGSISYAFYMFHMPIIGLYYRIGQKIGADFFDLWYSVLLWVTMIGVAHLSRETVERWGEQLKKRFQPRSKVAVDGENSRQRPTVQMPAP